MSELKPCPFCGEEQLSDKERGDTIPYDGRYSRVCDWCDVESPYWNTRPIEDAQAQEIARLEQRIRELEEHQRWIPVSERLPEVDTRVEIFGGFEQTTHIGYYREHATQWDSEDGGYWHGKNFGLITHWRPLPPPPKSEKEDE